MPRDSIVIATAPLAINYGRKGTHATVSESEGYQWVSTGFDDQWM